MTITPVNGNTQINGVRASQLQTGITVEGDTITGTVHNYTGESEGTPSIQGYNLVVDIEYADGEQSAGYITTGPTERPVVGIGGHRVFMLTDTPTDVTYIDIPVTNGTDTMTQRFNLNLTYD